MNVLFWVLAAFVLGFVILQGRTAVPRIFSFFSPGSRRLYFDDSGKPISQQRLDIIRPVLESMESLGFSQLGFMVDKPPLWAKGSREIVLTSQAEKTFASVGLRKNKPSYFFYTPFSGGQAVITAYNAFRDARTENLITTVVYSEGIREMLELHKTKVREFADKGIIPYQEYNRESIIQATYEYYNSPFPRRQLRVAGMINLAVYLAFLLVLFLLIWGALS